MNMLLFLFSYPKISYHPNLQVFNVLLLTCFRLVHVIQQIVNKYCQVQYQTGDLQLGAVLIIQNHQ